MRAIVVLSLAVFLAPSSIDAQRARITGQTHAQGDSTRVVPDAEVTLWPEGRLTRSDSLGHFIFTGVADGLHRVRVRRLGFEESEYEVEIASQVNRTLLAPMRANPQALKEVRVNGKRVLYPARYAEAYDRVANAWGDFFTRETIERMHPLDMQSLLVTIPGVSAKGSELHFGRCDDALNPFVTSGNGNNRAKVQVYVDGVRVTDYNQGISSSPDPAMQRVAIKMQDINLDLSRDVSHELRDIVPTSLQLMEVYRGVARIPARYAADACAVVLLWTK